MVSHDVCELGTSRWEPSSAMPLLWNFTWTVCFLNGQTPSFGLLVKHTGVKTIP